MKQFFDIIWVVLSCKHSKKFSSREPAHAQKNTKITGPPDVVPERRVLRDFGPMIAFVS